MKDKPNNNIEKPFLAFPTKPNNNGSIKTVVNRENSTTIPDPFSKLDEEDEKKIELSMEGFITVEPFNMIHDEVNDKDVFSISYGGVMEIVRRKGYIEVIGNPIPEHTTTDANYTVLARDTKKNISVYGMGQQPFKTKSIGNGAMVLDKYANLKALSKAQRNAFRSLLEPEEIQKFFEEWYVKKYNIKPNYSKIQIVGEYTKIK